MNRFILTFIQVKNNGDGFACTYKMGVGPRLEFLANCNQTCVKQARIAYNKYLFYTDKFHFVYLPWDLNN